MRRLDPAAKIITNNSLSQCRRALIAYDMESPHDLILNLPPIHLSELIRDAVSSKLAELLKDDEAGWHEAARWIDKRALEEKRLLLTRGVLSGRTSAPRRPHFVQMIFGPSARITMLSQSRPACWE